MIEIFTDIPGVIFEQCFARRSRTNVAGIPVNVISLPDLRKAKDASGRLQDLADLDNLPEV